ncbi:PREDICTED: prolactin regulatory element-binding protein [Nicrophorus vespilloides]|uniref:Prolactin regulatory element-binding protein n=1 Tax=Nicrophorus vespilloides TaxID=110193 RepID=A0ABM1NHV1_NICVS|nr:PREDICTED: prolactin regulatory element-binding protein [Nicrophorus vespilloides]
MAPTRRNKQGLLARVNFPLYTVQMLTSRHIMVGGGGGTAKTGVANGFEIYELSHDGEKFIVEEVIRHETGSSVVMNCAAFSDRKHSYIVAGQESHCQLYNVKKELVVNSTENIENEGTNGVRHRRNSYKKESTSKNNNYKRLTFLIKSGDSVQTDFYKDEPIQRVVRICPSGKCMATGGTDGIVRLWNFPSLQLKHTLKAHKKEIDDIDFCPFGAYLVTIAKDGLAILWDYKTGKEKQKLSWKQPEGSKYLFKRCRFGPVEGEKNVSALYMLSNPTGVAKKQKSYLQRWNPEDGSINRVSAVDESISALAVRDDGRFVAIGTMFSGSICIYIAFSLQKVLHIPGAHSMFVTGLEFLPVSSEKEHTVTSISEASVISISVDNQVCVHSLPYRHSMPMWLAILIIVVVLFLTFVFCSYLGI